MTVRQKLKIMLPKKRIAAQTEYNRPAALASHRAIKFPGQPAEHVVRQKMDKSTADLLVFASMLINISLCPGLHAGCLLTTTCCA
jgi:hypothetical protein